MKEDVREPSCVHSNGAQPASACIVCVNGEALAEWKEYWSSRCSKCGTKMKEYEQAVCGDKCWDCWEREGKADTRWR